MTSPETRSDPQPRPGAPGPPDDHDDEGYRGPATLTVDGTDHAVTVTLLGHHEPVDGLFHWYGRVAAHEALHAALEGRKRPVRVVTPEGSAHGEIADVDPWGRYRLAGTSTPPFSVPAPELDLRPPRRAGTVDHSE